MIPCEFMVTELLPTIRKETVAYLLSMKYTQRQIAKIMNVSEAAVSQYVKKKRGLHKKELERIISETVRKNYDLSRSFSENVCEICLYLRKSGYLCKSHKLVQHVSDDCCKRCIAR